MAAAFDVLELMIIWCTRFLMFSETEQQCCSPAWFPASWWLVTVGCHEQKYDQIHFWRSDSMQKM